MRKVDNKWSKLVRMNKVILVSVEEGPWSASYIYALENMITVDTIGEPRRSFNVGINKVHNNALSRSRWTRVVLVSVDDGQWSA